MNDLKSPTVNVLMVAAEASSELYARRIMEECKKRNLNISFFGIGSLKMKELGFEIIEYSEKMAVVGLWEVVSHFQVISDAFKNLLSISRKRAPRFALLMDYPDFNLRLAKKLNYLKIPIYYFISPQIWAWRTGRVELIKKIIKKMLVVFPFEVPFYKSHDVDVTFVGHPLLDELQSSVLTPEEIEKNRSKLGISTGDFVIGLLPGSRDSELKYNFDSQLKAAEIIAKDCPEAKFIVLVAPTFEKEYLKLYIPEKYKIKLNFVKDEPLKTMQLCHACIVASGTATLMTALAEIPMVIMYKMNSVTATVARRLVKGEFFGMPNLICGEKIVPELFQNEANPEFLAAEILKFYNNEEYYKSTKLKLGSIKEKLGTSGAAIRVVDEIERELKWE